ncbi:MAG: anti-sigma factor, partial [Caldilineaceae bacterium]|nr:anti-sigma factor [Caldilineaceae bacterium]
MDYNDFTDLSDDERQELLTGYALGALEPDEMLAVDAYVETHPELASVVHRLEDAVTAFAFAAPPMPPPAHAKVALMARVQADVADRMPQSAATPMSTSASTPSLQTDLAAATLASQADASAPVPFATAQRTARTHRSVTRRPMARRRFQWSFDGWLDFATGWKMATMASCVALLFFVIVATQLARQLETATTALTDVQGQFANTTDQLAAAQAELTSRRDQVTDLETQVASLAADKDELQNALQLISAGLQSQQQQISSLLNVTQVVPLDSTQQADASGALFVGDDSLVLVLRGLQPLPDDQTYELWLIPADSNPVSAGLVQVSGEESPTITADIRLSISSFAAVGLSIEQSGGSSDPAGPQGPVVLLGNRT